MFRLGMVCALFIWAAPLIASPMSLKVAYTKSSSEAFSHIHVLFPKAYANKVRNPVSVQLHLHTPDLEVKEHHLAVIVDDKPPFMVSHKLSSASHKSLMSFFIPFSLDRGQHLIRIFKVSEEGVILDKNMPVVARSFYFLDQDKASSTRFDIEKPTLSLLSPYNRDSYQENEPIPIDVHLHDQNSSVKNPKVLLSVDNQFVGQVCTEKVYQLEGLSKGEHTLSLVLYDGPLKCRRAPLSSCNRRLNVK